MRKDVAILGAALIATNVGWAAFALTRPHEPPLLRESDPTGPAADPSRSPMTRPLAAGEAHESVLAAAPRPSPERASPRADAPAGAPVRPAPRAPPASPPVATSPDVAATEVAGWKADALQISDPGRRERGIAAIGAAMQSSDPAAAAGALRSLYDLRDVPYDKHRFRDAVLSRLDDPDGLVRAAAASALLQVPPEVGDVERLLDIAARHPEDLPRSLLALTWLSKNRVEGRLADLFVQALAAEDPRNAVDAANQLRNMWVTSEVEDAALATWRRTKDTPAGGLWNHILGQIQPTREPRVRVIFEILKADRNDAPQLLARALDPRNLDPAARPVAVRIALDDLATAPNAAIRQLLIDTVRRSGTLEDVPALRAFAANPMVGEETRRAANDAADELGRRR